MKTKTYSLADFRFSGSYASRYMNCHGSAVLSEALPGFKEKLEAKWDTTPGGKIRVPIIGTQIHKIFEHILLECERKIAAARLLIELADVRGKARTELLLDEKKYITWWFMQEHEMAPIEHSIIKMFYVTVPEQKQWDDLNDEWIIRESVSESVAPALIRFLGEAILYVLDLIDQREGATIRMEETVVAGWTNTKPKTTADLVISDGKTLDIVDLKIGTMPIDAFENEQLLYYLQSYRQQETEYHTHIIQPKNNSHWQVSEEYLQAWVAKALQAEQDILQGSRKLMPGKHCLFCPANPYSKGEKGTPVCPAQMEALFGPPDLSIIVEEDDD